MALPKPRLLPLSHKASILYHSLFDYPLTATELKHWRLDINKAGFSAAQILNLKFEITNNLYHLHNKQKSVALREKRSKYAENKFKLAKQAAGFLQKFPSINFIGITGSLAMHNTKRSDDIDLMIITKHGTLWTTRLLATSYLLLATSLSLRRRSSKSEQDKLCLNIWMDETDLIIKKQSLFTAHEILQIKPLLDRNRTYEKFMKINKWALEYWPSAKCRNIKTERLEMGRLAQLGVKLLEPVAYILQRRHMRSHITNETVTLTSAFFHPVDWNKKVKTKLKKYYR